MTSHSRRYRLGVDIGGTFVDVVLHDTRTGITAVGKRLSDPGDPATAAVTAIDELLVREEVQLADVDQLIHATTIAPNTIIQRKGARTALLTTEGFGDILEVQRQVRHSPYDMLYERHAPLVPRDRVHEVAERLGADGTVHRDLDEAGIRAIADRLRTSDVEAIAISFLHSYVDGSHEQRTREILRESLDLPISISSEVAPVLREYERTSTTVANAYIQGVYAEYLSRMREQLAAGGFAGSFFIMQANGGLASVDQTMQFPIRALESGPAAGVIMAVAHGDRTGVDRVLAFDMGGTTAKVSTVVDSDIGLVGLFEVDRTLMRPGTGLPIMIPSVDIVEIGAGGGSIAAAGLGIVNVGPESAGASPGPAAYGKGGLRPTVTDANLVLGYLDPEYFNGGAMRLDLDAAKAAVTDAVGAPLDLPVERAAWGIYETVTGNMENAMRAVSIERGHDPRDFTLVASGGSGPTHAARIGRGLGVPRLLVPVSAGVMSAVGLLQADAQFDLTQSMVLTLDVDGLTSVEARVAELTTEAATMLSETGIAGEATFVASVEMRYVGQGHVVEVKLPTDSGADAEQRIVALREAFSGRYGALYGYSDEESRAEITGVRVSARIPAPPLGHRAADAEDGAPPEPHSIRDAYFPEAGGYVPCPVFRREQLRSGTKIAGPAIIEDKESTAVILPGDHLLVDPHHNLVIDLGRSTVG